MQADLFCEVCKADIARGPLTLVYEVTAVSISMQTKNGMYSDGGTARAGKKGRVLAQTLNSLLFEAPKKLRFLVIVQYLTYYYLPEFA
jgi:hypothetical protein